MYVALTRARNHLAVTYPVNVYSTRRGQDYSMDQLSRFLDRGVREKMQRVAVEAPADMPAAPAPVQSEKIDLLSLLRGRFAPPDHGTSSGPAARDPAS